ncbi:alpha-glucan family phosphorylase [Patescibacteria group bacterium]|nr:alpha-glucan family phosphorylase [Patescibacteria group bacterium]
MALQGKIAVFTPEVALDQELHTYSGGLGVFAGGLFMSAKKMGVPMVGMTMLPRQGYYDQYIDGDRMGIRYIDRHYPDILEDTGVIVPVPIGSGSKAPEIFLKVWRLPGERYGSVDIYFLDADIEQSDPHSRINTMQLYGGGGSWDTEPNTHRELVHDLLLGRGGMMALDRLEPDISLYHLNESRTAFAAVEYLCRMIRSGKQFDEAVRETKSKIVFTTHTPIRDGNPKYDLETVANLSGFNGTFTRDYLKKIGSNPFDMTAACLHLSRKANAVSKKHGKVAEKLWSWVDGSSPIISVTNGVNRDFWQVSEFRVASGEEDLHSAKLLYKRKLLNHIRQVTGKCFSELVLTIVWARRFAAYKRPKLLFHDAIAQWTINQLRSNNIQLVVAGKPHPYDRDRVALWNELLAMSRELPNFAMLPGYELELSKMLKTGADIWLNTPRSSNEACGTSGMAAAMNGALNVSTPDGWMWEASPENCFLFGSAIEGAAYTQDWNDACALQECLDDVIAMYRNAKSRWRRKQYAAKLEAERDFTSDRMLRDYQEHLYTE